MMRQCRMYRGRPGAQLCVLLGGVRRQSLVPPAPVGRNRLRWEHGPPSKVPLFTPKPTHGAAGVGYARMQLEEDQDASLQTSAFRVTQADVQSTQYARIRLQAEWWAWQRTASLVQRLEQLNEQLADAARAERRERKKANRAAREPSPKAVPRDRMAESRKNQIRWLLEVANSTWPELISGGDRHEFMRSFAESVHQKEREVIDQKPILWGVDNEWEAESPAYLYKRILFQDKQDEGSEHERNLAARALMADALAELGLAPNPLHLELLLKQNKMFTTGSELDPKIKAAQDKVAEILEGGAQSIDAGTVQIPEEFEEVSPAIELVDADELSNQLPGSLLESDMGVEWQKRVREWQEQLGVDKHELPIEFGSSRVIEFDPVPHLTAYRERKATLRVHVPALKLPKEVRARLLELVGPRYDAQTKWLKLTADLHRDHHSNKLYATELMRRLLAEAWLADLAFVPFQGLHVSQPSMEHTRYLHPSPLDDLLPVKDNRIQPPNSDVTVVPTELTLFRLDDVPTSTQWKHDADVVQATVDKLVSLE